MKITYKSINNPHDKDLQDLVIREADKEELRIFNPKLSTIELIQNCVRDSTRTMLAKVDGKPAVLFGVKEYPEHAAPWMISSHVIETIPVTFCKIASALIDAILGQHDILVNYVDARNTMHVKWLKWIGFKFMPQHDFYYRGCWLNYFEMRKE